MYFHSELFSILCNLPPPFIIRLFQSKALKKKIEINEGFSISPTKWQHVLKNVLRVVYLNERWHFMITCAVQLVRTRIFSLRKRFE